MENRYKLVALNEYKLYRSNKCIDIYVIYDMEDDIGVHISMMDKFNKLEQLLFLKCIKLKPFPVEQLYILSRIEKLRNILSNEHRKIFWNYIDQKTFHLIKDCFHRFIF